MKKILLIFIIIFFVINCFSQNTFLAKYNTVPFTTAAAPFDPATLIECHDGNAMGLAYGVDSTMILYKINNAGNLLWWKQFAFPFHVAPSKAAKITDSTIVFMIQPFAGYSVAIMKVNLNGDLIWIKTLSILSNASFVSIAPTTDDGFIISGRGCLNSNIIIHFDEYGTILSQHIYTCSSTLNVEVFDMVHDGNNQFAYCGNALTPTMSNLPFVFFKTDSAGNAYNYTEYYIPQGFGTTYSGCDKIMAKSPDGGHYCMFPLANSVANKKFALFHFNSQDQLDWSKFIETPDTIIRPVYIVATPDNGCLIIAQNFVSLNFNPLPKYLPAALKFDVNGNLEWSKMAGDTASSYWNRLVIRSITPTSDNGWFTAVNRIGYFNIGKVDSTFNGLCNDMPFTPIITDFIPQAYSHSLTSLVVNFIEGSLNPIVTPLPVYRVNECLSVNIEENNSANFSFTISPNPASNEFQISNYEFYKGDEIILTDVFGKILFTKTISTPTSNFKLQTSNFFNGIYFLQLKTKDGMVSKKVVVQR